MDRRGFVQRIAATGAAPVFLWSVASAQEGAPVDAQPSHSFDAVVEEARRLSGQAFERREGVLAPPFSDLSDGDYARITPNPEARIALGGTPPVAVEPLPPGSVFDVPVEINRVDGGAVQQIAFSPRFFSFDPERFEVTPEVAAAAESAGMGFSGFRVVAPIDRPDMLDPVAVFQGASQFRGRPRDGVWGASARGLAIGTASPTGEEVPVFTRFWLYATGEGDRSLRCDALLDGPSVTGAYAFEIRPGAETSMVVRCRLFPRVEIGEVGIAPITSMHYFGPDERNRFDDMRDAVHDSDGLQIVTGQGERIWRPLSNPPTLQLAGFVDVNPRGFGLVQRARDYGHFGDPRATFERRPSVWIEPLGEWGRGQIILVEIPLPNEVNDNIVAFWRPVDPLRPGQEYAFDYGVTFAPLPPDAVPLARVASTRSGAAGGDGRRFAVEFDRDDAPEGGLEARLSASRGSVTNVVVRDTPEPGRIRVEFSFAPEGAELSELRLVLTTPDGTPASETWLHRWIRS
jgi:glucans biosynthesis protein